MAPARQIFAARPPMMAARNFGSSILAALLPWCFGAVPVAFGMDAMGQQVPKKVGLPSRSRGASFMSWPDPQNLSSSELQQREVEEVKMKEDAWGNHEALSSCFGPNYKTEGAHEYIGHCFHEHDTHNTCCMLDQAARDQNDKAGNPIGQRSLDAYLLLHPEEKDKDHSKTLTPWCTCFFSQVCSFYAQKTETKVKFVNDCGCSHGKPGLGFCLGQIPKNETSQCEGWARESFRAPSHATPGVETPPDGSHCPHLEGKGEVKVSKCTLDAAVSEHPSAETCADVCAHVGRPVKSDMAGKSGSVSACCEAPAKLAGNAELKFLIAQPNITVSDMAAEQQSRLKAGVKKVVEDFVGKDVLKKAKLEFAMEDFRAGNGLVLVTLKVFFPKGEPPKLEKIASNDIQAVVKKVLPKATVSAAPDDESGASAFRPSSLALVSAALVVGFPTLLSTLLGEP